MAHREAEYTGESPVGDAERPLSLRDSRLTGASHATLFG